MQFLTLEGEQLKDLNRVLLITATCGVLFGGHVANYYAVTSDLAWEYYANILILSTSLITIALRKEMDSLIGAHGREIIICLLINNSFDRAFGIKGWSWNDGLVVIFVALKLALIKINWKKY